MKSKRLFTVITIVLCLCSCIRKEYYKWEKCNNIDKDIIDDICKGYIQDEKLANKQTLLYTSNNECSECIADFIDFSRVCSNYKTKETNIIYWIYGCNKIQFDYYTKRENVIISNDITVINDTLDLFHTHIDDFYSNNLFFLAKNGQIYKMISNVPINEWNLKEILLSKPGTEQ